MKWNNEMYEKASLSFGVYSWLVQRDEKLTTWVTWSNGKPPLGQFLHLLNSFSHASLKLLTPAWCLIWGKMMELERWV